MMATETAAMDSVATVTAAVAAVVVPVDGASYMVGKVLRKSKTGYKNLWTGPCWRSLFSILVLILTLVSAGRPGRDAESV